MCPSESIPFEQEIYNIQANQGLRSFRSKYLKIKSTAHFGEFEGKVPSPGENLESDWPPQKIKTSQNLLSKENSKNILTKRSQEVPSMKYIGYTDNYPLSGVQNSDRSANFKRGSPE